MGHNHNHNFYNKYSDNKQNSEKNEVTEEMLNPLAVEAEETVTEIFENVIEETINEELINESPVVIEEVKGYITNCLKLNVRAEASKAAEVLCVLEDDAEVIIDLENSTVDFYKVCTSAGVEGYCMKKFIAVK